MSEWPEVAVARGPVRGPALELPRGGRALLGREPLRARFDVGPLDDDDLVRQHLAPVAAVLSSWCGRLAFQAAAVVAPSGAALALAGPTRAGKSTLLAAVAAAGHPSLGDELVCVEEGAALAGPNAVVLRPAAEEALARGRGGGRREAGPTRGGAPPASAPLGGWVFLEWGPGPALEVLSPSARVAALGAARVGPVVAGDEGVLDLARLPAWRLTRPRRWETLPETVTAVAGLLATMD